MLLLDMLAAVAAILLAFTIGFAIRRGSICLVDASYQWVVARDSLRMRAFSVASGAAACAILPLAWLSPALNLSSNILSPSFPITASLVLAAACFALGARINGGCTFGTLSKLSGGNLDFSGTVIGAMTTGLAMAYVPRSLTPSAPLFAGPDMVGIAALIGFILLASPAFKRRHWQNLRNIFTAKETLLRPFTAMVVIGVLGGVLFALAGSWTHLAVIGQESAFLAGESRSGANLKALAGAVALVSGALFAAIHSGRFQWQRPRLLGWTRCFVGGMMMGTSSALIPGGNGALLIYGVPSGSLSAWAAFAMMLASLALSFLPQRLLAAQ